MTELDRTNGIGVVGVGDVNCELTCTEAKLLIVNLFLFFLYIGDLMHKALNYVFLFLPFKFSKDTCISVWCVVWVNRKNY